MVDTSTLAPGARLLIRDEEWLVKSTLPVRTGGVAVRVVGLSELVRNHEAVFLTELDRISELKPEQTRLVNDDSPQYRRSRLYLESLLRRTPPTDEQIYLGHNAAIDFTKYQLQPAHMALHALRPRILIADGVGLGKTIEVGILLSELIKRARGDRILVVATRAMLAQFQEEIWTRFTIPLVRLDSIGLQRVRAKIPSKKNPFYYYDRVIISVDTLKNDAQYRYYLEQCHWDIIVIDECHNVANAGSDRNRLATLLARTCDSLILTSATPHNGRAESFANLMNMLEPTAIADVTTYTASEISGLFTRRFKKDIEDQVAGQFKDRSVTPVRIGASTEEEAFFNRLSQARFHTLDRGDNHDELYRIGLLKSFLSSPEACVQTIDGRLSKIEKRLARLRGESNEPDEEPEAPTQTLELIPGEGKEKKLLDDLAEDRVALAELRSLAVRVHLDHFSKFNRLLVLLEELGIDGSASSPRVIIFSERIPTLQFLLNQLQVKLGVSDKTIVMFHAGLPDIDQQSIVESFGKEDSPIRILLASDVASEGVNLHFYCHLMIHFDIPWSLITLEQRNGRIDRFGQAQSPEIYYLLTVSRDDTIRGDLRVLDRLIEKEQEAHKNIGDAATILGLHDAQKEEDYIAEGMAKGESPDEIFPPVSPEKDWLDLLMEAAGQPESGTEAASVLSLYRDDLEFTRAAFDEIRAADPDSPAPEYHPNRPEFSFFAPEDLRRRCEFMPQEAIPENWMFSLTTDRDRVKRAIVQARRRERAWPQVQLFWEMHPVMEWVTDKLLVRFGRHEAPVIISSRLSKREFILLFQGILSNKRSQPLVTEWFGLLALGRGKWQVLALKVVLDRTGFEAGLPNAGTPSSRVDEIAPALSSAVEDALGHLDQLRLNRGQSLGRRLRDDQRKLRKWRDDSVRRIDEQLNSARGAQAAQLKHRRNEIEALFKQRETWLTETFTAVPTPYLRLAAVFSGG